MSETSAGKTQRLKVNRTVGAGVANGTIGLVHASGALVGEAWTLDLAGTARSPVARSLTRQHSALEKKMETAWSFVASLGSHSTLCLPYPVD